MRVLERRPSDAFDGPAGGAGDGRRDAARDAARRLRGRGDRVQPRRRAVVRREGRGAPAGGQRRRPGEPAGRGARGRGRAAWCRSRASPPSATPTIRRGRSDEDSPFPEGAWRNRYARTKRLGEEVVRCAPPPTARTSSWSAPASCSAPATSTASTRSWSRSTCAASLRTTVAGGLSSVDVRDVAEGLLARGAPGRERAPLHPHERGRQPQPPRRSSRSRARSTASAAARCSCRRRCSSPARASGARCGCPCRSAPRRSRPRALLVLHAGARDRRARLPAAPGARGDGGDREATCATAA